MPLPLFDALQVQHDAARRLMRFQWLDQTNAVLRPALAHGRDLVEAHRPTHVLMDFTGLPPIAVQDELWLSVLESTGQPASWGPA